MASETGAPGTMGKTEYARHRGVTPAMVTHWSKAGRIVIVDGRVDAVRSDALLAASLDQIKGGKRERHDAKRTPGEAPRVETPTSKALIEDKQAGTALKRLKLEREAGRLVSRAEYERTVETVFGSLRAAMLAIPNRLGARLAAEIDPRTCTDLMREEIARALNAQAEVQDILADRVGATQQ